MQLKKLNRQLPSIKFSSICITDIFALYVSVFIYVLRDLYTDSYTLSTLVELYEISHIFYI